MAENKVLKAKVKATGLSVEVYKLANGGWCNFANYSTIYSDSELEFIK